ncbi:hypothetical protein [Clostridium sp. C8-1-8]|uniref:hypothetical protein n=1 Tax=Clostridium sp. C8-1-8 TaxID=2698831 RepID=UPI00136954F7|nr:hypothetical protein [Clostridium sp. C8-1-8]
MPKHRHRGRNENLGGMNNMGPMGNMGNMGNMNNMNNMNNMSNMNNMGPMGNIMNSMMGSMGSMNPLSFLTGGLPFPFSMNPQMSEMFNNIDLNNLSSLFSSMSPEGFDLNNLGSMFNSFNGGSNNGGFNSNQTQYSGPVNFSGGEDGNISMLRAVRSFVDPARARFIDRVIEMYQSGEIEY